MSREQRLIAAFVELADTLVDDFDIVEFLYTLAVWCVELLDVDLSGLLLSDQRGGLQVVASSSACASLVELLDLSGREGPGLECLRTVAVVECPDCTRPDPRWPLFSSLSTAFGVPSVHSLPMRHRSAVVGVLSLFRRAPGAVPREHLDVAQALADVATIGLLQERAIRGHQLLAEQLQYALNSRVIIEQAKGVLAERMRVDAEAAFGLLRCHARRSGRRLEEVARDVISGRLDRL